MPFPFQVKVLIVLGKNAILAMWVPGAVLQILTEITLKPQKFIILSKGMSTPFGNGSNSPPLFGKKNSYRITRML
jgi:hypothetical protein